MCELLGITSKKTYAANEVLASFYNHGSVCRDGWGLAVFRGDGVTMEKEPICSLKSSYLSHRLTRKVEAGNLFAHIRKATLGRVEYANCHPFIWDDHSGRTWTLMHNGTVFKGKCLLPFREKQEGSTDSERVLLYLIEQMNEYERKQGEPPGEEERFRIIDDMIVRFSEGNKLNLMIYDGAVMYVHTNSPGTLYLWQDDEKCIFATVPVWMDGWDPAPQNQLLAYRNGRLVREGTRHFHDFRDEDHEEDYKLLYSGFSEL